MSGGKMFSKKNWVAELTIILFAVVFLTVCSRNTENAGSSAQSEILMKIDTDFSRLSVDSGIAVAFSRFAADSAVMLRNGSRPIKGRQLIDSLLSMPSGGTLDWLPYFADASGNLGYTLGRYRFTSTDSASAGQKAYGYYVSIWKRQSDGNWRWVLDTGVKAPADENQ
jgi:ketosteroid isomerase-like protein